MPVFVSLFIRLLLIGCVLVLLHKGAENGRKKTMLKTGGSWVIWVSGNLDQSMGSGFTQGG